jgi:glycine cleavage system H lipoate-binding protein
MNEKKDKHRVIPENESDCIWMKAGLVSYKLCDRNYDCENCAFDIVMRQRSDARKSPSTTAEDSGSQSLTKTSNIWDNNYLQAIVNSFFTSLLSRPIPDDRLYSQGHMWLLQEKPNSFTIGLDHIVSHFLKSMQEIVLPQVHTPISTDSPCIWIACHEGTVTIRSPLQGKVERTNSRLIESAHLLGTSPYSDGWLISVYTNESPFLKEKFLNPDQAKTLFTNQIYSIQREVLSELNRSSPEIGQTMCDGGMRARNFEDIIGSIKYFSILEYLVSSGQK